MRVGTEALTGRDGLVGREVIDHARGTIKVVVETLLVLAVHVIV